MNRSPHAPPELSRWCRVTRHFEQIPAATFLILARFEEISHLDLDFESTSITFLRVQAPRSVTVCSFRP